MHNDLYLEINGCRNTNLVVESNIGEFHFHQPLKHGYLQVEVLSELIYCGTGAQLKGLKKTQVHHML